MKYKKNIIIVVVNIIILLTVILNIFVIINGYREDNEIELYKLVSNGGNQSVIIKKQYNSSLNTKYVVIIENSDIRKTFRFFTNDYSEDSYAIITGNKVYICIDKLKGLEYNFEWNGDI